MIRALGQNVSNFVDKEPGQEVKHEKLPERKNSGPVTIEV